MITRYRSLARMNEQILDWIPALPRDLDLIVGIPRSGLLAANLLALHLNLPVADLDGFAAGRILGAGVRFSDRLVPDLLERPRRVLVVDDSLLKGDQMARARQLLRPLERRHRISYAAVYVQPGQERKVDYLCESLPTPRVFEWHLMHHSNLRHWCLDLDGVLCRDPLERENDDGIRYRRFLRGVPPLIVPTGEIGWIVTCRLEKYRRETEAWLQRHGIVYRHLVMMDHPDGASRRAAGNHAAFKADIYRGSNAQLFIESSRAQAREIARLSGASVFCTDTREMIQPDSSSLANPCGTAA